jgi:hypothetical protein
MCNHNHKQLETYPDTKGYVEEKCIECGKPLGKLPGTFASIIEYCKEKKISTHIKNPNDPLSEYLAPTNDNIDRTRFKY